MSSETLTFSVMIPVYKTAHVLGDALESVRKQSYPDWEIVLVLDGPDDTALAIAKDFQARCQQPVIIEVHPVNKGLSEARNTGMRLCSGNYIAFLDSDDMWEANHLEVLLATFEQGVDLAYSEVFIVERTDQGLKYLPIDSIEVTDPPRDLFRRNFINPSATALHRKVYECVGDFNPRWRIGEDRDYWIRAAAAGFRIQSTGQQTVYYTQSPGTISKRAGEMAFYNAQLFAYHADSGILSPKAIRHIASDSYNAAGRIYRKSDWRTALQAFQQSIAIKPMQTFAYVGLCACLMRAIFK